ncbi:Uncharacterised protein [Mycobacteroides abscessus subsp. abscessus]|nr:Uncharacterised protein [Mycobacteroides abscessus subsp. abscessus]
MVAVFIFHNFKMVGAGIRLPDLHTARGSFHRKGFPASVIYNIGERMAVRNLLEHAYSFIGICA